MKFINVFVAVLFVVQVFAQDIHFSQMRFAPLNVNPGAAGLNGKYNAIVNYRTQWNSVADPFTTMGASFDMKFEEPRRNKGFLAAGINFYHDIAGDLRMTTSNVNLSVAYHLRINRSSTFGLGLQAGYGQRGIGSVDGLYASQHNGTDFDQNMISGKSYIRAIFGYVDVAYGIVYNHNTLTESTSRADGYKLTKVAAAYHLTRPHNTFMQGGNDDFEIRFTGSVELEFVVQRSPI